MTVAFLGQMQGVKMDFNILKMHRVVLIKVSPFEKVKPLTHLKTIKNILLLHFHHFQITNFKILKNEDISLY
jgi:hypothetical protein